MSDLISREQAINEIGRAMYCWNEAATSMAVSMLRNIPAVDAMLVKRGKWSKIFNPHSQSYDVDEQWYYECSECKWNNNRPWEFCPHCGAKMDIK